MAINDITWFLRFAIFVLPVVAFLIAKRVCIGLQRRDRETLLHGMESGIIMRMPNGEFIEVHKPVDKDEAFLISAHERQVPIEVGEGVDENGVAVPHRRMLKLRSRASQFYFGDVVQKPTAGELESAHDHNGHNGHGEIDYDGGDRTKEVGAGSGGSGSAG